MTLTTETNPRIYVASLSDYNAGILHGVWISLDADTELDDVWAKVKAMLAASPATKKYGDVAEEWAIHDYEGFGGYGLSEYESFEKVLLAAKLIAEKGEAAGVFLVNDSSVLGGDYDELEEAFSESYQGCWDDEETYARNLVEDIGLPGVGHITVAGGWDGRGAKEYQEVLDDLDSYLELGGAGPVGAGGRMVAPRR